MTARSYLFVPGDSEKKMEKAGGCGADAIILDLEDAVSPDRKAHARELVATHLATMPHERRRYRMFVRINALDSAEALKDLVAVVPGNPDGIVLPKVTGPSDVRQLSFYLDALEAQSTLKSGTIAVLQSPPRRHAPPLRWATTRQPDYHGWRR